MITLPTTCHLFDSFFIEDDGPGKAYISVIIKFENNFDYKDNTNSISQVSLEYTVNRETDFKFRFFYGAQNNQITYLDEEVVGETE